MTLSAENNTAWFSSSVPESTIKAWTCCPISRQYRFLDSTFLTLIISYCLCSTKPKRQIFAPGKKWDYFKLKPRYTEVLKGLAGGIVVQDFLEAKFLFSDRSGTKDVQRLFKSKEFFEGHLTVFSSKMISVLLENKCCHMDVRRYILLPRRKFQELGMRFPSIDSTVSEEEEEDSPSDSDMVDSLASSTRPFSPREATLAEQPSMSACDVPTRCSNGVNFCHCLFDNDIVQMDDTHVAPVRLMDFKPGVNGCRVVCRKRTATNPKHKAT